jgi:hypothetical protein
MTQAPAEWLGDTEGKPAPAPLTRIQALVNTIDLESGADRLALAADAQPWLQAQGLLPPGGVPTTDELRTVRELREALRAMLVHNAGGPVPTTHQLNPLSVIADAAGARVHLGSGGILQDACSRCCWWYPMPNATAPGLISRPAATRTAGGRSTTDPAITAAPGATWLRAATS